MRMTFTIGDVVTEEHIDLLRKAQAAGFSDPRLASKHIQTALKYGPASPLLQDCNGNFPLLPASLFEAALGYLEHMEVKE